MTSIIVISFVIFLYPRLFLYFHYTAVEEGSQFRGANELERKFSMVKN